MRKYQWVSILMTWAGLFTLQAHADAPPGITTVGGLMYTDWSYQNQQTCGSSGCVDSPTNGYGLDVKRFYLSTTHVFDDVWSANLTTDFNYTANSGETQLFVKKAYVQAKVSNAFIFQMGADNMPWIPFDEDVYGYRFVEKPLIDRLGFGNSDDWGIHMLGKNDINTVDYNVAVVNGGGYKNPTRTKTQDIEARVGFMPTEGLVIAIGGYYGDLGQNTAATPAINNASREDVLIDYKTSKFSIGAEYFHADNFATAYIITNVTNSASGYSVWGNVGVGDSGTALFARYDYAKTNQDISPYAWDKYGNAGVSFPTANKNITWAFVYKYENTYTNLTSQITRQYGIWAQIVF